MPNLEPKKTHKQQWDEAQRGLAAKERVVPNPYRVSRNTPHPYDPLNPGNPYTRTAPTGANQQGERGDIKPRE